MRTDARFWNQIAEKYRAQPISNQDAYENTLERVASHLRSTDRVLELGCGTGGTAWRLADAVGEMLATDFSSGMIAQAEAREPKPNLTFQTGDVHDVRLVPASFDVVMGFNLFHLVLDFEAQLARVYDLVKPGGLFISKTPCLTDPTASLKYRAMVWAIPLMQLAGKAPYVKFHKINDLQASIEAKGFSIIETGNYPSQPPNHLIVARKT